MARTIVDFPTPAGLPFSAAVSAGELLYLSGQIGYDLDRAALVEGGVGDETAKILSNTKAVLAAAGKTLDDIVKVNVYLTSMGDFAAVNEVYARHFEAPYPARTAVEVAGLPLGAAVEMEFIAR